MITKFKLGILLLVLSPAAAVAAFLLAPLWGLRDDMSVVVSFWACYVVGSWFAAMKARHALVWLFFFLLLSASPLVYMCMLVVLQCFDSDIVNSDGSFVPWCFIYSVLFLLPVSVVGAFLSGIIEFVDRRTRTPEVPTESICEKCGYNLRGLTRPRCPECGTPFDARLLRKLD